MTYYSLNSWSSYAGTVFWLTTTCIYKTLKFYGKSCVISNVTKTNLHISASQVQRPHTFKNLLQKNLTLHCVKCVEHKEHASKALSLTGLQYETYSWLYAHQNYTHTARCEGDSEDSLLRMLPRYPKDEGPTIRYHVRNCIPVDTA